MLRVYGAGARDMGSRNDPVITITRLNPPSPIRCSTQIHAELSTMPAKCSYDKRLSLHNPNHKQYIPCVLAKADGTKSCLRRRVFSGLELLTQLYYLVSSNFFTIATGFKHSL